ncbi:MULTISPECIES: hypothetical protein [Pseudomonas syringae group]|nr:MULTISPECIES: hypothetical protein [Pseudomonas syringae group]AVB19396.1 hypothetical protein BKM03_09135 [Pseudomonas avellanae]KPZ11094.1 hypothetical protein ALO40_200194 [Pseudomonas syringae pv. viburni]POP72603.1 hypothetical protein CXB34_30250 [Pseudomonas amygdali pv. morsprunorum]SOQ15908.1 hypothetical protein CFBP1573P_05808 [Pseudomonas syringae pv. persicae]SOQ16463.1 hypothetical protein NCPPB2254_05920 [Pseudomonas syringae pv. persicae]
MKSALKGLVVTTVAVIGLQGIAFAGTLTKTAPTVDGKYAIVQDSGKGVTRDIKAVPAQVALRSSGGLRIRSACDDTGLPCPRG